MSMEHREFFRMVGKNTLNHENGPIRPITIEDLYQQFKARMINEAHGYSTDLLNPVDLEDGHITQF